MFCLVPPVELAFFPSSVAGVRPLCGGVGAQADIILQHPSLGQYLPHLHQQIRWVSPKPTLPQSSKMTLKLFAKPSYFYVFIQQMYYAIDIL